MELFEFLHPKSPPNAESSILPEDLPICYTRISQRLRRKVTTDAGQRAHYYHQADVQHRRRQYSETYIAMTDTTSTRYPTIRQSNLTEKYIRLYLAECTLCHEDYIYVGEPDWAFGNGLPSSLITQACDFFNAEFSEVIHGNSFCPHCNISIMPDEIADIEKNTPGAVIVSGRVVQVLDDTPVADASKITSVLHVSHITEPSIRFYRGTCTRCDDEFIYDMPTTVELKVPNSIVARLEANMGCAYGKEVENALARENARVWRCNTCLNFLYPSTQFAKNGWGTFCPEYAMLSDGNLYEITLTEPVTTIKSRGYRKPQRISHGSEDDGGWDTYDYSDYSGYSYSSYGSYRERSPEEKMKDIEEALQTSATLRPKASSAGLRLTQVWEETQTQQTQPLALLPTPSAPEPLRSLSREWSKNLTVSYQSIMGSKKFRRKFQRMFKGLPEKYWDDAIQILTVFTSGVVSDFPEELIHYLEEHDWISTQDKYWSRLTRY